MKISVGDKFVISDRCPHPFIVGVQGVVVGVHEATPGTLAAGMWWVPESIDVQISGHNFPGLPPDHIFAVSTIVAQKWFQFLPRIDLPQQKCQQCGISLRHLADFKGWCKSCLVEREIDG